MQNESVFLNDTTDQTIEFSVDPNLENLQYTTNQQQIDLTPQNLNANPQNILHIPTNTIQINDIINTLKANDTEVILNTFHPNKTNQNTTGTIINTYTTNKTQKTAQKSILIKEKPPNTLQQKEKPSTLNDSVLLTFPSNQIAFSFIPNTPNMPENPTTPSNFPDPSDSLQNAANFAPNHLQRDEDEINAFENPLVVCGVCKEAVDPEKTMREHKCFRGEQESSKKLQECSGIKSGVRDGKRSIKVRFFLLKNCVCGMG